MIFRRVVTAGLAAAVLGGCGEDEAAPATPGAVDVRVRADPDGDGPGATVERRVRCEPEDDGARCRALRGVPDSTWAPVPGDRVCTRVYGGPQTARVTGTVAGRRVDARFSRVDGCDLARWRTLSAVLDPLVSPPAG